MNIRKHYESHAQWNSLVDLQLDQLCIIWVNELEPINAYQGPLQEEKKK